ncbi:Rho GTPase activation protein [Cantharellus anzutake]|uniref:Rho GTPase activation protein n=1 Tax=Cantharellus anzutake TaxID=1750568 RepID=UPI001903D366|nr:Rho GTPase activation protein [Cantharellus anzutake]KAF8317782.1 Rho GTPase activation protein [Cantharellus anzutake]
MTTINADYDDAMTHQSHSHGYRLSNESQHNEDEQPVSPEYAPRASIDSLGGDEEPQTERQALEDSSEEPFTEINQYVEDVVQPGFDEAILRALCEMDGGVPLLLDRIKQSMVSCREASIFLKKRAVLEEEYGRGMQKLARQSSEVYSMNDGKAGTYVSAWHATMKIHEIIGDNHVRFATRLNEMNEELSSLSKEVDKNRKGTKELASRYERSLQESEATLDKAKNRFDLTAEELQRFLISKEGESSKEAGMPGTTASKGGNKIGKTLAKGGMLLKVRSPANLQRQEDDIRSRMSSTSDAYRKAVMETQTLRQEYFNFQLPRILRSLKECADEIDLGLQYHLSRYAFLMESTALSDGTTLSPTGVEDGPGIKHVINSIDNAHDFKVFMQHYLVAHAPKGPRREGPWEEGFLPPLPSVSHEKPIAPVASSASQPSSTLTSSLTSSTAASDNPSLPKSTVQPTFGVHLAEQMVRDNVELPKVVEKCCRHIQERGFDVVGIYRLSGTTSKVQKLKTLFDRDVDAVDLSTPEWADINIVSSALKLWFRDLPEPLLTWSLYYGFIEAAKIENDRLRHIRLHERVNDLPDPNYATLKYLIGHLHQVTKRQHINQMSASNLSIVFGPTLLGPPPLSRNPSVASHSGNGNTGVSTEGGNSLQDMNWQCKAIETILEHYEDIFVDENEERP